MRCGDCPYWQTNPARGSPWGDCYRIVSKLCPQLTLCTNDLGHAFAVPFDPHDVTKYFKYDSTFKTLYHKARQRLPKGVRVQKHNGLHFFQTHMDYECKEN